VAAGYYHSVALRGNGLVVAWGSNGKGQTSVPGDLSEVVAIAAGGYHSVALRRDGTVTNWGTYYLPDGPTNCPHFPASFTNIAAIAAGDNHDLLVQSNGNVLAWGADDYGKAEPPAGLANVQGVAAGGNDSVALLANGRLSVWGCLDDSSTPAGLSAVGIAAGNCSVLAIKPDGKVAAWGTDQYGGPVQTPASISNATAVAIGGQFCLALFGTASVPGFAKPLAPRWEQGTFRVSVQTSQGKNYQLECVGSAADTNWCAITNAAGDGSLQTLSDPGANGSQRFYRVRHD